MRKLQLPSYSYIARRSPGGTVKAIVTVGLLGKAAAVETPGADEDLAEEVRDALIDDSSYAQSCAGQRLEIIFTFELRGEPEVDPKVTVLFHPPNHFVLISPLKKANVLIVPLKKP